jgi:hypothetical protein
MKLERLLKFCAAAGCMEKEDTRYQGHAANCSASHGYSKSGKKAY